MATIFKRLIESHGLLVNGMHIHTAHFQNFRKPHQCYVIFVDEGILLADLHGVLSTLKKLVSSLDVPVLVCKSNLTLYSFKIAEERSRNTDGPGDSREGSIAGYFDIAGRPVALTCCSFVPILPGDDGDARGEDFGSTTTASASQDLDSQPDYAARRDSVALTRANWQSSTMSKQKEQLDELLTHSNWNIERMGNRKRLMDWALMGVKNDSPARSNPIDWSTELRGSEKTVTVKVDGCDTMFHYGSILCKQGAGTGCTQGIYQGQLSALRLKTENAKFTAEYMVRDLGILRFLQLRIQELSFLTTSGKTEALVS